LHFSQKKVEKDFSKGLLDFISYAQIIIELVFFTIIMHSAGGVESISTVFFFLPVVSASLIFGSRESILTAVISSILINWLIIAEYYGIIRHIPRYGVPTVEYLSLPISLTKTITTSIFYIIVGAFAGYGAKRLFNREKSFEEKARLLDEQTRSLSKRGQELSEANEELDDKVAELERFQKQAVGRELKMIELKNKIKNLESKPESN
jgi:K+-sensing histidine kinase KdpD